MNPDGFDGLLRRIILVLSVILSEIILPETLKSVSLFVSIKTGFASEVLQFLDMKPNMELVLRPHHSY